MAIVLTTKETEVEQFQAALSEKVTRLADAQSVHEFLEKDPRESLLIVGHLVPMGVAADISRRYRLIRPGLGILVMRDLIDVPSLSEALNSGIRELVSTDDANALLQAVKRSAQLSAEIAALDATQENVSSGKTVLVFGAKGGCGKTTIATNLALALADDGKKRVCLVDFDLEFGDVAISLSLSPEVTLSAAVKMAGGLDRKAVESLITKYKKGLDVVIAPTKPSEAEFISPEIAVDLLQHLRQMYDYVIIDAAPSFTEITLRCFEMADIYQLITTLDVPSVKNLKVAIDTLDALGYPRSKWHVVLNRSDANVGLSIKDVEDLLGVEIGTLLPSSREVPAALNSGHTMWESQRSHPFTASIEHLAGNITGKKAAVKHTTKRGWLAESKK